MRTLKDQIRDFLAAGEAARANAAQLAALQCLCGVDLAATMRADAATRADALARIDRLLERERLKGLAGHWSYDLNRHIALKQAGDRLRGIDSPSQGQVVDIAKTKRRPRAPLQKRDSRTAEAVQKV